MGKPSSKFKKIVVLGASGQLGNSFRKISGGWSSYDFYFFSRTELDILDEAALTIQLEKMNPDVIINCAAYTAVDKAETDKDKAYQLNRDAIVLLNDIALKLDCLLFHYSSDYIYHNEMKEPMPENASASPQGVYAKSKYAGEQILMKSETKAIILRTSWVFSEFGNNFMKTMVRLGNERDSLSVVDDQLGAPTYAPHLAEASMKIIDRIGKAEINIDMPCVYNYASEGVISWSTFAQYIFEIASLDVAVNPIPSVDYPTPASRPLWSVMDMGKIKEECGIAPHYWKDGIHETWAALNE